MWGAPLERAATLAGPALVYASCQSQPHRAANLQERSASAPWRVRDHLPLIRSYNYPVQKTSERRVWQQMTAVNQNPMQPEPEPDWWLHPYDSHSALPKRSDRKKPQNC